MSGGLSRNPDTGFLLFCLEFPQPLAGWCGTGPSVTVVALPLALVVVWVPQRGQDWTSAVTRQILRRP